MLKNKEKSTTTRKFYALTKLFLVVFFMISIFLGSNVGVKGNANYPLGVASNFNAFVFNNVDINNGSIKGRLLVGNEFKASSVGIGSSSNKPAVWIGKSLGETSDKFNGGPLNNGFVLGENEVIDASIHFENRLITWLVDGIKRGEYQDKSKTIISSGDFKDNNINSIAEAKQYYQKLSSDLSKLDSTTASEGEIKLEHNKELILKYDSNTAVNNTVYFNIPINDFNLAPSLELKVNNKDLDIIINIPGNNVTMLANNWGFLKDSVTSKTLVNFYEAKNIVQRDGLAVRGVILAPQATFNLSGSDIYGKLIVNNLNGKVTLDNGLEYNGNLPSTEIITPKREIATNVEWIGGSNSHPEVSVDLLRNGEVIKTQIISDNYTWSDLEVKDGQGNLYEYTINLTNNIPGYNTKVENFDITLTYEEKFTDIEGTIEWSDNEDTLKLRPESFVVELYRNGNEFDKQTITNEKEEYSFKKLAQEDENFKDYEYEVKVVSFNNYLSEVNDNNNIKHTINVKDLKTNITWIGGPESKPKVKVALLQDGKEEATEEANKSFAWPKQLIKDENKKTYDYTIKVLNEVEGYNIKVEGLDITLTYKEKFIDIKGTIEWSDNEDALELRPESFVIKLYQNGKEIKDSTVTNKDSSYIFEDLAQEDENFKDYEYEVKVKAFDDYKSSVNKYDIKHNINVKYLETKITWIGGPNSKPNIKIELLQNAQVVASKTTNVSFTWPKQLIKDENNENYTYTTRLAKKESDKISKESVYFESSKINEDTNEIIDEIEDYSSEVEGLNVILKYKEKRTKVKGTIEWSDNDNSRGIRPASFVVELYQNKIKFDERIITNDENEYVFEKLPKEDENFNNYEYSIKTVGFDNYLSEIDGFNIKHTFVPNTSIGGNDEDPSNGDNEEVKEITIPKTGNNSIFNILILLTISLGLSVFTKLRIN